MSPAAPTFARSFVSLAAAGFLAAAVVGGIGVAVRHATSSEVAAVLVGCATSWVASCVAAAPTALALSTDPRKVAMAALTSTAVRFVVVLMLVVPLVFSGWFPRTLFVSFVAMSYMLILLVDSAMAVRMVRRYSGGAGR